MGRGPTAAGPASAAMLLVRVVTFWLSVPASSRALDRMNSPRKG